jgi:hypothetical protein
MRNSSRLPEATENRRLRDTVVFSGLFGAVPRATVRATSAARRPRSTRCPVLVTESVSADRKAAACAVGRMIHSPIAPSSSCWSLGSRPGIQMSSPNSGGFCVRSAITWPISRAVMPLTSA